jgi:DNA-dependent RNA polymerase auxiliary subunit epsilon
MMVEQRAKELEDFWRMLRPEAEMAFGEVLGMMGANAGAADYPEPASPRRGMDLSLYIEAEIERQELKDTLRETQNELEQITDYLAERDLKTNEHSSRE